MQDITSATVDNEPGPQAALPSLQSGTGSNPTDEWMEMVTRDRQICRGVSAKPEVGAEWTRHGDMPGKQGPSRGFSSQSEGLAALQESRRNAVGNETQKDYDWRWSIPVTTHRLRAGA
jgi:hypothetical protein